MEKRAENRDQMFLLAEEWVSSLKKTDKATVVGLVGDLGSGKTTFVQGVAKALGVNIPVTSPTFVIQKKYTPSNGLFSELIHIDAYRLVGKEEAHILNLEEAVLTPHTLILIEWPELLEGRVELDTTITFTWVSENERMVSLS